ncbi:MAG: NAD(P)-dependent oxidoreductase [Vampirovibrionales bacterium]|jgi:nucleoside-diphosphate-sugar epimerase|nr:NAD(P)-dependent oxidoreductase [Vampirovibrionales bacterium]
MKVLMTGATGFIGYHVLQTFLENGDTVAVLGRTPLHEAPKDVDFHHYDGTYPSALEALNTVQPDIVVHLATHFVGTHQPDDVDKLLTGNIGFGLHLLEAMKQSGCRAWLNAASAWQYAGNSPFYPNGLYAASKSALDALVSAYVHESGLQAMNLVIYESYGKGDSRKKLIPQLLAQMQVGQRYLKLVGKEKQFYFVHVQDIAEAFVLASHRLVEASTQGVGMFSHYALRPDESPIGIEGVVQTMARAWQVDLTADYGAFPFRANEVLVPPAGVGRLPDWEPKISLEAGLASLWYSQV